MKLLHLDSSITGEASVSRQVSAAIVRELASREPSLSVAYHDLAADPAPHLTFGNLPGDQSEDARQSAVVLQEFLDADIVVIGAPMYNFSIPSQLKAWLDRILIKGKTFQYGANGPEGLAGGKRVIIAVSRGGLYGAGAPGAALEHLETYLRGVFGFIGITPEVIVAEGIGIGPEQREASIKAALQEVSALGRQALAA